MCGSPWGSRSYVSTNYPAPTYRFQYSELWSLEMITKNLDKTTTKLSLEKPLFRKADFTGIIFELKDFENVSHDETGCAGHP